MFQVGRVDDGGHSLPLFSVGTKITMNPFGSRSVCAER